MLGERELESKHESSPVIHSHFQEFPPFPRRRSQFEGIEVTAEIHILHGHVCGMTWYSLGPTSIAHAGFLFPFFFGHVRCQVHFPLPRFLSSLWFALDITSTPWTDWIQSAPAEPDGPNPSRLEDHFGIFGSTRSLRRDDRTPP